MFWIGLIVMGLLLMEFIASIIKNRLRKIVPFTGGNGCNFMHTEKRAVCCTEHDRAYKAGGWYISRKKADIELLKCVNKQDHWLPAITMWIGCTLGAMWAFQFGKKRDIVWDEENKRWNG